MQTKIYRCASGDGELRVSTYTDGFEITTVSDSYREVIILDRYDAQAIINQLQEYLNETSESTPA